jgi:hypothetical protein
MDLVPLTASRIPPLASFFQPPAYFPLIAASRALSRPES